MLLVLLILLLQTPFVQNYIADEVLAQINGRTRQTAKFTNIRVKWFDFVEIKGLEVRDYQDEVMISASNLKVNYRLGHLLSQGNLTFDEIYLKGGGLNLTKYKDTLDLNLIEFIHDVKLLLPEKSDTVPKAVPYVAIGKIRLDQFDFSYDNQPVDSLPMGKFDYGHFALEIPGATISDFWLRRDTIRAGIRSFAGRDPESGLRVEQLQTNFLLHSQAILLQDLSLTTQSSVVRNHVGLQFSSLRDLSDFTNKVTLDIQLTGSKIAKSDLSFFVDIPSEDFTTEVTANITGTIPKLSIARLQLAFGMDTYLEGSLDFMGLPIIDETFIDARITTARVNPVDLEIFTKSPMKEMERIGEIGFSGRFLGFVNDFVANAVFETEHGDVYSDLNLKFPKAWEEAEYIGKLRLDGFDLGAIIGDSAPVGRINMQGSIDGRGLTRETARFFLDAEATESEFLGYRFDLIKAEGQFASEFFEGKMEVDDPNCQIITEGSIDLSRSPERLTLSSRIDVADLKALGLSREALQITARVDADLRDLNLDSLQGRVQVAELDLVWKGEEIQVDSIFLTSERVGYQRQIELRLPEIDLTLEGDFYFSEVSRDFQSILLQLQNYFNPEFYAEEEQPEEEVEGVYSIEFSLEYGDISRYLAMVMGEKLYLSPGGTLGGTYYQRRNATLSLFAEIDSLNYGGFGFKESMVDVNLSKDIDSTGILASLFINSKEQRWANNPPTNDLELEAVWFNNRVSFSASIAQPHNNSSADVSGEMMLADERLVFNFLPSRLIAFGERWYFNPYNKVTITKKEVVFDRMELYQNDQSVLLKGIYSDSSQTNLSLTFNNFDLHAVGALLPISLGGVLNASVDLAREDILQPFIFDSDLDIQAFELDDFLVGNVTGGSKWNTLRKALEVDFKVQRESVNTISINGTYKPEDSVNQLDVAAKFDQANLQMLDPFFQSLFSNIGGYASGNLRVTGSASYPVLNGSSSITEGRMTFDYLGTTYSFDGDMVFDNKSIRFNGFSLRDRENDRASLNGAIYHKGFKNFSADLRIASREFQFLNTAASENSPYYGTANATGDISIRGPFSDLVINAKATTEKGTKLFIPLSGSSEISQKDYISFVNLSDSTNNVDIQEIVAKSISGIRLDFEIDVTPDAYVELIFDIRTGDIIRGRGVGNLNMTLDTNGEFELFGDLTISEGGYNFTIPALGINKEFNVVPGSTITWYGDPYAARLDLNATYRQLASFDEFSGSTEQSGASPKYPILVVLGLEGDMLAPEISFSIELEDSQSSLTSEVQRYLSTMNNDEQELKRQVFSLLILRKFSAPSNFSVSGGTAVGSSLSEFLSNQFSYFISQVDENLEVDVDLASLDEDAFNTFQLRLSYTFLDGRLRVSGGGAIPQNSAQETEASNDFIGDWSIRYLLTDDGHFRVKAFSRTEQIANDLQRETGMSFQYIKSFNDLKELLTKNREEAIRSKPKDVSKEKAANQGS